MERIAYAILNKKIKNLDTGSSGTSTHVQNCKINNDGYLIITLSDGSTINAGLAKGADGVSPIIAVNEIENGAEIFIDGVMVAEIHDGEKGEQGLPGEKGEKGEQGTTYVPSIGTVNSVENNVSAKVSVSVNESTKQAVFSFDIPKGKNATTDTALNVNSNNAIANKIVTNKFNEIDTTLGDIETVLESLVEV